MSNRVTKQEVEQAARRIGTMLRDRAIDVTLYHGSAGVYKMTGQLVITWRDGQRRTVPLGFSSSQSYEALWMLEEGIRLAKWVVEDVRSAAMVKFLDAVTEAVNDSDPKTGVLTRTALLNARQCYREMSDIDRLIGFRFLSKQIREAVTNIDAPKARAYTSLLPDKIL